jgi:uncharacterized protein DUF262
MRKKSESWSVRQLKERHVKVNFPEYQREPTVWSRSAKQRLIDSMLRNFDISSLYLYANDDGSWDCIDGRQRIGAIMSFLGLNPDDTDDNGFDLKFSNEIYEDEKRLFDELSGVSYDDVQIRARAGNKAAKGLIESFEGYELGIVLLSASKRPEEFNLQFTRLNLGSIINSGEKLHAMVGEIRDICFNENGLGRHAFLDQVEMSTRRYAKEQVVAQILAQVFAVKETGTFTRTRHFDLQKFFKDHSTLDSKRRSWVAEVTTVLNTLARAFDSPGILRNRAITVSTVLFAWKLSIAGKAAATAYASFVGEFLCRVKWQLNKGLEADPEYRYLLDFQRHVTQASVERPAVQARAATLEKEHSSWVGKREFTGDAKYLARTRKKASEECRKGVEPAHE